jgi:hypothetical protein
MIPPRCQIALHQNTRRLVSNPFIAGAGGEGGGAASGQNLGPEAGITARHGRGLDEALLSRTGRRSHREDVA